MPSKLYNLTDSGQQSLCTPSGEYIIGIINFKCCGFAFLYVIPGQLSLHHSFPPHPCPLLPHAYHSACPHFLSACLDLLQDQVTPVFATSLDVPWLWDCTQSSSPSCHCTLQCLVSHPRLWYLQPLLCFHFLPVHIMLPADVSLESLKT